MLKKQNNYDNTVKYLPRNIFKDTNIKKTYDKHDLEVSNLILIQFINWFIYFNNFRIPIDLKSLEVLVELVTGHFYTQLKGKRKINLKVWNMALKKVHQSENFQIEVRMEVNLSTSTSKEWRWRIGTTITLIWITTWLSNEKYCIVKIMNLILELGGLKIMVSSHLWVINLTSPE